MEYKVGNLVRWRDTPNIYGFIINLTIKDVTILWLCATGIMDLKYDLSYTDYYIELITDTDIIQKKKVELVKMRLLE